LQDSRRTVKKMKCVRCSFMAEELGDNVVLGAFEASVKAAILLER
jgi:hypothetical protein